MIKAVIFDIDNTLYSYDENHIYGMELWLYTAGIRLGLQQTRCRPATERPDGS